MRYRELVESEEYWGEHEAPDPDNGAPLFNLIANGIYPKDVYESTGFTHYASDAAGAYSVCLSYKGRPNRMVKVYRAVPAELVRPKIMPGNWVALTRAYAREHGAANLNGKFRIISKTVFARDLFTEGNSLEEWGYVPQPFVPRVREDEVRLSLGMLTVADSRARAQARKAAITEDVGLSAITARQIIDAIPQADYDIQINAWLGRAYNAAGKKPSQKFIDELDEALVELKRELRQWIDAPTPLMRGLQGSPENGRSVGTHWTDYRYTALSHGHYIMHATVLPGSIDWMATIMRRLSWPKEREFSLLRGTIMNYEVEFNGKIIGRGTGAV